MKIDLTGKTALVTGSSQGIGLSIATELSKAGATVVLSGRSQESLDAAAIEIADAAGADLPKTVAADLGTKGGIAELVVATADVDILVNNLGIYESKDALDITDDDWQEYLDVNLLSAVRLTRALLPAMMRRKWGRILYLASDAAIAVPEDMLHYGVSKTALVAAARGYAKVAAGSGVTVNSVIAGPTKTDGAVRFLSEKFGTDTPWEEAQARFMATERSASLIKRLIDPTEIANMIVYLSSPQASATTGGALRVDGGYVDSIFP
ncbi:SDR family NAD(P)-dependent oxidoreductase [Arthrobacter sp. 2MCAF15]|uniref:SDR family NAD(P)-dependent oxidoreductase n=1 Tax=Arthrobacter sp. 2MCAF15 TaxID=3232984 RepID=UPI003F935AF6